MRRDCEAIRIPSGEVLTLPRGTQTYITQALGGSFTLQVRSYGGLFRISGQDADAIGKEIPEQAQVSLPVEADLGEQVTATLKTCYDPEIPVNIVDLGLVYDTRITRQSDGTSHVGVKMTLTAPGCGMGAALAAEAQAKLRALEGVSAAVVEVVWDPRWTAQMISEEGRKQLGISSAP